MKKTLIEKIIPLMLSTSITASFMYIYNKDLVIIFGILAFIINLGIFSFYDYFSKKGIVGRYCSILGGFAVIIALLYFMASGEVGDNGIDFMIWFLSPQGVVEYSARYTYTLFIGVSVFTSSTVYYFTQVRYRIFVTFLIMLIPLAIFAKENEKVPVPMLAVLLAFYTAVMIHCRQTAVSEQDSNVRKILDGSYKKSSLIFIFSAVIISFAVPKPEIEANREYFESMISANGITQYLLSRLGDFSDTSGGSGGFAGKFSNTTLFYCYSEEPINLKARTYTNYNAEDDTWYINNSYDRDFYAKWEDEKEKLNPADFLNTVYTACGYDKEFADRYGIKKKNPDEYNLSEYTKSLTVVPQKIIPEFLLVPSHTFLTNKSDTFFMSPSGGVIKYTDDSISPMRIYYSVSMSYYSDMLSDSEYARDILENLNAENYNEFLNDLESVLIENNADEKNIETVEYFIRDYETAVNYCNKIDYQPTAESPAYSMPAEAVDFEEEIPDRVKQLAEEITKDYISDIEKAEALEMYFFNNGFKYDADYTKPDGYNTENFLFDDKKGACYEYSTAMVLMARAIGIPARYNEGFMVSDYNKNMKAFEITDSNSHAYPELFISGYGWLVFEPTITDIEGEGNGFIGSQQFITTMVCVGIIILVILTALFIKFVYPAIYEKYFRYKLNKASSLQLIVMIMKRLRKLSEAEEYLTSNEFAQYFYQKYDADISDIAGKFDLYVYGDCQQEILNRDDVIANYQNAYEKICENKRKCVKKILT